MSDGLPRLVGRARVPGDKSLAHRALLLAALADAPSRLAGVPRSRDVDATRAALEALGCRCHDAGEALVVEPPRAWKAGLTLNAVNSGTTARLLAGALVGRACAATIVGDASLSRRPMDRVVRPLRRLGARVAARGDGGCLPLAVAPAPLHAAAWRAEVASAQVKSAFLLAALGVDGEVEYREATATRDHLENLLPRFGVEVRCARGIVRLRGPQRPRAADLRIPGDASSAAVLVVGALLLPGSDVVVEDVVANPTRLGFARVLEAAGGELQVTPEEPDADRAEPTVSLRARGSALGPLRVTGEVVPSLVDELPLLVLAAAFARGESRFEGLGELRYKESDRLDAARGLLEALGVPHDVAGDDLTVHGGGPVRAGGIGSRGDHRLAMVSRLLALRVPGSPAERDPVVEVSWPGFHEALDRLQQ